MLLVSGYHFFPALLRDIASAQHHIHLCVYIFDDDALGRLVADALISSARRGILVRVLYDDVGCWRTPRSFFDRMRREGIEVEAFLPVRFPSLARRANNRNHRKLMIIDGRVGYVGGFNIALRYVRGWRDTMVRMEDDGVGELQQAFLNDWFLVDRTRLTGKNYFPPTFSKEIYTITSSPSSPTHEMMQAFVKLIHGARQNVFLQTPYFLPPNEVLFALIAAATAGIDVRLMVPARSDFRITGWAMRSYLRQVAGAGVKVWLYKGDFLHAKTMVVDGQVAVCGSTNIDYRSMEDNYEVSTFFRSAKMAEEMTNVFLDDERQSVAFNALPHRAHPSFFARILEKGARLFSPLM